MPTVSGKPANHKLSSSASTVEQQPPLSPAPSFAIQPHKLDHINYFFSRSISHKDSSFFEPPPDTPPRSRISSCSQYIVSEPSTPKRNFLLQEMEDDVHPTIYRCMSSVLRRDGQISCITVSNGLVYTGCQINVVRIWKLPEFIECGQLKTKASSSMAVAIHVSDDKVFVAYAADSKIRVWRRIWVGSNIKHVRVFTVPRPGNYVWSYFVSAGRDKTTVKQGPISAIAINVLDDILYSASIDKTIKVWRISQSKCIDTILAHSEPVNSIIVTDDGVVYTASDDATIKVWRRNFSSTDHHPHSLITTLRANHSPVKALTLASDGGILYAGCSDGYIHYWLKGWFLGQMEYGGALQGHTHAVMCLANAGNYLVSGSADLTCRVWVKDPEEDGQQLHRCMAVLKGHKGPVRCVVAFIGRSEAGETEEEDDDDDQDDDECIVCSGSLDGAVKMWRIKNKHYGARVF